jgi:toxin ParE1/3/4
MTRRIIIRPKAGQDLDDHFAYITENNFEAALLFFDSARSTIAQLARTPGIGNLYPVENPRLQGLRRWAVKDFRKYLIFYLEHEDTIEIMLRLCEFSGTACDPQIAGLESDRLVEWILEQRLLLDSLYCYGGDQQSTQLWCAIANPYCADG